MTENKFNRARRFKKVPKLWMFGAYLAGIMLFTIMMMNFVPETNVIRAAEISRKIVNTGFFIDGLLCIWYYFHLRRKCGRLPKDYIWIILGVSLVLRSANIYRLIESYSIGVMNARIYLVIHSACITILFLFLVTETCVAVNCFRKCPAGMDHIIIHGAKSGSNVLSARTEVAGEYLQKNEMTLAIASGGRGKDEETSEAVSIRDYLMELGISEERILLEDRSTDTIENVRFSKTFLSGPEDKVALVTDDYHVFRARCIARKELGRWVDALPVHSSRVSLPHYIFREYLSTCYHFVRGDLVL